MRLSATDPVSLCALDGGTFRILWKKPLGAEHGDLQQHKLGGSGRGAVLVDPLGVAHIHDARSGAELSSIRLGTRVELMCAPPELPGRVWVKTTDKRGVMIDTAARAATDAPRPASCPRMRREFGCSPQDSRACPAGPRHVTAREVTVSEHLVEGANGVVFGSKRGDLSIRVLAGFDARAKLTDPDVHTLTFEVRGGRAVAAYKDVKKNRHVFALDAVDGRPLWDIVTQDFSRLGLSATRLYVERWRRLDVYDAATGRLLGGIGPDR